MEISFNVYDHGSLVFTTPSLIEQWAWLRRRSGDCGADPLASHLTYLLSPGSHSIDIISNAIADAGAAVFPGGSGQHAHAEPGTVSCFGLGLGLNRGDAAAVGGGGAGDWRSLA